ncbi:MAG: hypothetical protein IKG86_08390 [Paludibacteraceae bacterium]|nr:hypothetical protein [Paludibacteraceae bacterium]
MKRFTYLLSALFIILLSANASPVKSLKANKKADVFEQVKHVKATHAHALPAQSLQKATPQAAALKRAPQAKHDNYNVTITNYAENFYATDNDVWVKLYDADGNIYYFDIVVAEGTQELALGQAYTLADMIPNYSYMRDANGKMPYASASLTKTVTMYEEEQELVHFAAAFTDTLGNNYTLNYDQAPFIISGDTLDVVFTTNANKPIYSQGMCQLSAENDDYEIAFTFPCAEGAPAGTYGEEDMALDYTYVNDFEAVSAHCVVIENNGTISLEGWILAKDGNVYHVTFSFTAPTAETFETITATNLVLDDSYASLFSIIIVEASNEDYTVSMYLPSDDYLGTFDAEEVSLSIEGADSKIEIYEGTITVANTATGVAITGTVLSMDGVQYTLNLQYVIPDATSQETITMSGTLTNIQNQAWQFIAKTDDRYVSIAAYSTTIPGTYGRSDLAADYTLIGKFENGDTLYYRMVDANVLVVVNGENAVITGTLKGQNYDDATDVIEFALNLTATVEDYEEEPQGNQYDSQDEGFYYKFPTYNIDDQYLAQYNVFVVEATDAENHKISIEFNVAAGTTELAAGVYPIASTYAAGTVSAGTIDQYIYGSFAGTLDEEGYIKVPLWLLNAGTVTVLENGVIEVAATNTWGQGIYSRLGQYPEGVENTEIKGNIRKVMEDGQIIILKDGKRFTTTGIILL